jgi:L-fuculose-phosphate aldolase
MTSKASLCREIIRIVRILSDQGLIRSSDGNVSVRWMPNRYIVTPSGLHKMDLTPRDLVVVDGAGLVLAGRPGLSPTSEVLMHLEAYRLRPDVHAVIHAHPPYATALTIAGIDLPIDIIPETLLALGRVPTAPYAHPGTADLALSVRPFLPDCNAMLLSHHGSLNAGRTLTRALIDLERIEHTARTFFIAKELGPIHPIPQEKTSELEEIGRRFRTELKKATPDRKTAPPAPRASPRRR